MSNKTKTEPRNLVPVCPLSTEMAVKLALLMAVSGSGAPPSFQLTKVGELLNFILAIPKISLMAVTGLCLVVASLQSHV